MTDPFKPILKPNQIEGIVTLSSKEKRKVRLELFNEQHGICACGCGRPMSLVQFRMNSVTLDHRKVRPAGCKKNDARSNLQAMRWDCNVAKGSKRNYDGGKK
jgi:hypothetical protein